MTIEYSDGKISSSLVELNGLVTWEIELHNGIVRIIVIMGIWLLSASNLRPKNTSIILGNTIVSVLVCTKTVTLNPCYSPESLEFFKLSPFGLVNLNLEVPMKVNIKLAMRLQKIGLNS